MNKKLEREREADKLEMDKFEDDKTPNEINSCQGSGHLRLVGWHCGLPSSFLVIFNVHLVNSK